MRLLRCSGGTASERLCRIWGFSARKFTESTSGWPKVPVLKK